MRTGPYRRGAVSTVVTVLVALQCHDIVLLIKQLSHVLLVLKYTYSYNNNYIDSITLNIIDN